MTPNEPTKSQNDVPFDAMFDALSRRPRRRILESLRTRNPRTSDEFEELSYWPEGTDEDEITLQLHHRHLPSLEDAGFIDRNQETDTIVKGPRFDEIRPLLELMADHEEELPDDWP